MNSFMKLTILTLFSTSSIDLAASPFGGADHSFTVNCRKQIIVNDVQNKKVYDLGNEEVSIGKFWTYKGYGFRVSSYFVNKKYKLSQPLVILGQSLTHSEDEEQALIDSKMMIFNLDDKGKIRENHGAEKMLSQKLPGGVERTFTIGAGGEKTLFNTRTTVLSETDPNVIYYRQLASLDNIPSENGMAITKSEVTCTYIRLPDTHFARTPGALLEQLIYRFDGEIKKLKEMDQTPGAEAETQAQLQHVLDLLPTLTSVGELEKTEFAKQRQKKPAVIYEDEVLASPWKRTKAQR